MGNFPLTQFTSHPQSTDDLLLIAFLPFQHKLHGTEAHGEAIGSGNSLLPTSHRKSFKGLCISGKTKQINLNTNAMSALTHLLLE